MLRAITLALLLAACEEHGSGGPGTPPDAAGSGSAAFDDVDASPQDTTLSMIVIGLTALVVVGAGRARRREPRVEP